jgi:hypothetical protein
MQSFKNGDRGISSVRTVAHYLSIGEPELAAAATKTEWDKISTYPEIARRLVTEGLFEPIDLSKFND